MYNHPEWQDEIDDATSVLLESVKGHFGELAIYETNGKRVKYAVRNDATKTILGWFEHREHAVAWAKKWVPFEECFK